MVLLCYCQEEQRAKAKQAREDLRSFLENHKKMHSSVRWRRAGELFQGEPVWEAVHERDRKDVFEDVVFFLAKKEKEEEKEQRVHNRKLMLTVYSTMPAITYRTTWAEVSLLEGVVFYASFLDLISMKCSRNFFWQTYHRYNIDSELQMFVNIAAVENAL